MKPMIAYCGVDCSGCTDLISGRCPSCRLTEWKADDICMPVKCCREKSISCCALCDVFPCRDMADFYDESDSHREAFQRMLVMRGRSGTTSL